MGSLAKRGRIRPVQTAEGEEEMTYDEKCLELAQYFLHDFSHLQIFANSSSDGTKELAETIQIAIEDWLKARGLT
jgi:hypothetical protein